MTSYMKLGKCDEVDECDNMRCNEMDKCCALPALPQTIFLSHCKYSISQFHRSPHSFAEQQQRKPLEAIVTQQSNNSTTQKLIMQTKMQVPPLRNGSCGGKQVTLNHKPTRHSL